MSEHHDATSGIADTSRRGFLKYGVGLVAGSAAAQALPGGANAQGAGDAELVRLQGARRIVIKGAVVLTVDRRSNRPSRATRSADGSTTMETANLTSSK
jgi:hypothetical protein